MRPFSDHLDNIIIFNEKFEERSKFWRKKLRKTCDNPLAKLRLQQYQQTDPSLRFAELTKLIKY